MLLRRSLGPIADQEFCGFARLRKPCEFLASLAFYTLLIFPLENPTWKPGWPTPEPRAEACMLLCHNWSITNISTVLQKRYFRRRELVRNRMHEVLPV